MNLLSAAERLASIDRSAVTPDQNRCLHTINKFSNCEACFEVCPVEAIQVGKPPTLNKDACQTCLACLPVCPVGAYTADDAVPALLNCAARLESRRIDLICGAHPNGELGLPESEIAIRVRSCLAGLGSGAYLALIALGMERVIVRMDACNQCPWGSLQPWIKDQIGEAQRLLEPWRLEDSLAWASPTDEGALLEQPVWNADNPPLSRRDLFRLASQRGQLAAARVITSGDQGTADRRPNRDRRRVVAALAHILIDEPERDDVSLAGMGFATVSVSDACTACGVCARACPTGALEFQRETDGRYCLAFFPKACIGCEICTHVCAPGAITMDHQPSFGYVFSTDESRTLHEGELVRCERCNTMMAAKPGSRLCPVCEFRLKNPFGSVLPPGFKARDRDAPRE